MDGGKKTKARAVRQWDETKDGRRQMSNHTTHYYTDVLYWWHTSTEHLHLTRIHTKENTHRHHMKGKGIHIHDRMTGWEHIWTTNVWRDFFSNNYHHFSFFEAPSPDFFVFFPGIISCLLYFSIKIHIHQYHTICFCWLIFWEMTISHHCFFVGFFVLRGYNIYTTWFFWGTFSDELTHKQTIGDYFLYFGGIFSTVLRRPSFFCIFNHHNESIIT